MALSTVETPQPSVSGQLPERPRVDLDRAEEQTAALLDEPSGIVTVVD